MSRTDIHLDAMLRHLGAAYYESLHGRATRSDVNRALDTVEEHLHEQVQRPSPGAAGGVRTSAICSTRSCLPRPEMPMCPCGTSTESLTSLTDSARPRPTGGGMRQGDC